MDPLDAARRAARTAGFASLAAILLVVAANYGVNFRLLVPGNAVDTARNILAHETLFRLNIACNLGYLALVTVVAAGFYVLLKEENRPLALRLLFQPSRRTS